MIIKTNLDVKHKTSVFVVFGSKRLNSLPFSDETFILKICLTINRQVAVEPLVQKHVREEQFKVYLRRVPI